MICIDKAKGISVMNLTPFREAKNMPKEQLAFLIGVSYSTIQRWEAGKTEPRASELNKLCEVLGCTTEDLCGGGDAA